MCRFTLTPRRRRNGCARRGILWGDRAQRFLRRAMATTSSAILQVFSFCAPFQAEEIVNHTIVMSAGSSVSDSNVAQDLEIPACGLQQFVRLL